jgi:putative sigma-54 modulation protein
MQTTVTARHCEIPEALRQRAVSVVERLGSQAPRPLESTIVFDSEGMQQTAEIRLHLAGGEILVAKAEGADHRTALDRAEAKVRRQVERISDRSRTTRSTQSHHR